MIAWLELLAQDDPRYPGSSTGFWIVVGGFAVLLLVARAYSKGQQDEARRRDQDQRARKQAEEQLRLQERKEQEERVERAREEYRKRQEGKDP